MNQAATHAGDLRLSSIVSLIDKNIRELQDKTLGMRMTPLKGLFLKTQRVIRDLAVKLEKPVEFHMTGEDTEIDRTMVDMLGDPLMHIARNSLDHGIEKKEARHAGGKPEKGVIHLSAELIGGRVLITVADDGAGINRQRVIQKAVDNGLFPRDQDPSTLSDKQVYAFLFMPGFSTAEKVTDVSGRGVGMDVVKSNIEKLKGSIDIQANLGKGTRLTISIPLTTSITDGMIIQSEGQPYIVPIGSIRELVHLEEAGIVRMQGSQEALHHRGKIYPIVRLKQFLTGSHRKPADTGEENTIVLIEAAHHVIALRTEKVLGQAQVVLKSLGTSFERVRGIAGATILGDGKVALILDPEGMIDSMRSHVSGAELAS